ncbi:MAG: hypothetical protein GF355_04895 [Candidatus Eisenbacteria bacterium]|nr:hypothetical protein [Candidatus Eisenbacteria bacterium]
MSTPKLAGIIKELREIDHVNIIRIGTKVPGFNPQRIVGDASLREMLHEYSTPEKRIYIMAHFNHPRELTDIAVSGLDELLRAGAIVVNQTPLIRGVNDDVETLTELFRRLSFIGAPPYYVFQCRPTAGNKMYSVPVETTFRIFDEARSNVSGLAQRARMVMSHATGKIEVLGLTADQIIMRYHRPAEEKNAGRLMFYPRNPRAHWFDDYLVAAGEQEPEPEEEGSGAFDFDPPR